MTVIGFYQEISLSENVLIIIEKCLFVECISKHGKKIRR